MASKLPAPLPLMAAGAGVIGFAASRLLGTSSHGPAAPTGDQTAQGAPLGDTSMAGTGAGDLWSQFGGGGQQDFGDGSTGPGAVPPPYPIGGGDGGIPPGGPGPGPGPAPTPPPPPAPSPVPTSSPRPAGAVGTITANGLRYLYTVSGGVATRHGPYSGLKFTAWVAAAGHYKPNATLYRILSGTHAGSYAHVTDVTFRRA